MKVSGIIKADDERRFVIPSAPGKRNKKDTKVTDMLYACYEAAENDKPCQELLKGIEARYDEIIKGLGLELSLKEEFKTIAEMCIRDRLFIRSQYFCPRPEREAGFTKNEYICISPAFPIIIDFLRLYCSRKKLASKGSGEVLRKE